MTRDGRESLGVFTVDRDGSHALAAADGYGDPFSVVVEGHQDVAYNHSLTVFWNQRGQLMFSIWNEFGGVQGAGSKVMTLDEAKKFLVWLKLTIAEHEGA